MADPPSRSVLLVTGNRLGTDGIGSLFLRDLIKTATDVKVVVARVPRFLLESPGDHAFTAEALWIRLWSRVRSFHSARLSLFRKRVARTVAVRLSERAKYLNADCIWLTASSPEVIYVGEQLASMGLDLRITVWDAPEYMASNMQLSPGARREFFYSFDQMMQRASRISVTTKAMGEEYLRRYGASYEVIRHGIDMTDVSTAPAPAPTPATVNVVFAGSLYAKAEWNSFVDALSSAGWRIDGHTLKLHFIGRFPNTGALRNENVVFYGELSFAQTMERLSQMQIGYLPYWLDESKGSIARTSFPGKLSAYGVAGLAVFFHGPAYAEVASFFDAYRFGVTCDSRDSAAILDALRTLIHAMDGAEYRAARDRAVREELSATAMAHRFSRLVARIPAAS